MEKLNERLVAAGVDVEFAVFHRNCLAGFDAVVVEDVDRRGSGTAQGGFGNYGFHDDGAGYLNVSDHLNGYGMMDGSLIRGVWDHYELSDPGSTDTGTKPKA